MHELGTYDNINIYMKRSILLKSKNLGRYKCENNFCWTIKIIM